MIPDDHELVQRITSITYQSVNAQGTITLEEREEMKRRPEKSPDLADSLMLSVDEPPPGPSFSIDFIQWDAKQPGARMSRPGWRRQP